MFGNRMGASRAASGIALLLLAACGPPAEEMPQSNAIVFHGATVIVGDGSDPIDDATFVIEDGRFVAAGAAGEVMAPEGAAHVDLSGRTVIPALIDTHVHLSVPRDALIDDLRRRAYYGVGVAVSLGHDDGEAAAAVRDADVPGRGARDDRGPRDHPARARTLGGSLLDKYPGGRRGRRSASSLPRTWTW